MRTFEVRRYVCSRYVVGTLAVLLCVRFADAQKKASAPAPPPKPAAAPAKPAVSAGKQGAPSPAGPGARTSPSPTTSGRSPGPLASAPHATTSRNSLPPGNHAERPVMPGPAGRPVAPNSRVVATPRGQVQISPTGNVRQVHLTQSNANVHYGINGSRHIDVARPDGSHIVASNRGGYVGHEYSYHGHDFEHRTYYYNGRPYDRFYGRYEYRPGYYVNYYRPAYYYPPAFYGYVYNPWSRPVVYSWGWNANPWYGYYGYYFAPAPVYPTASLWLTDYMISTELAAAYQAGAHQGSTVPPPPDAAPITPDVKEMIAAEVQKQIQLEYNEANAGPGADANPNTSSVELMFKDGAQHVFVAATDVDLVDAGGNECAISDGDALQLSPPQTNATVADLVVLSSKGGKECHKGASVSVAVADLQEMQNHMRETIGQGMGELKANQNKGGLPPLPASANGPEVKTEMAANAPPPDNDVATELKQETAAVDREALMAVNEAGHTSGPGPNANDTGDSADASSKELSVGMSEADLLKAEGKPTSSASGAGTKKIYLFPDNLKVTLLNGKVRTITAVQ